MPNFGVMSEGPRAFFLDGELDLATVPLMSTAIEDAVARGGPLSIDMTAVTFVDSTGIGAILKAAADLPSGCIVLHGVHDGVQKVVDLMGVGHSSNLHIIPCILGSHPTAA